MTLEMSNGQANGRLWTREQVLTLAALISCLSIYGITISLFTLSVIGCSNGSVLEADLGT